MRFPKTTDEQNAFVAGMLAAATVASRRSLMSPTRSRDAVQLAAAEEACDDVERGIQAMAARLSKSIGVGSALFGMPPNRKSDRTGGDSRHIEVEPSRMAECPFCLTKPPGVTVKHAYAWVSCGTWFCIDGPSVSVISFGLDDDAIVRGAIAKWNVVGRLWRGGPLKVQSAFSDFVNRTPKPDPEFPSGLFSQPPPEAEAQAEPPEPESDPEPEEHSIGDTCDECGERGCDDPHDDEEEDVAVATDVGGDDEVETVMAGLIDNEAVMRDPWNASGHAVGCSPEACVERCPRRREAGA